MSQEENFITDKPVRSGTPMSQTCQINTRGGRWRNPTGFVPELDFETVKKNLGEKRRGFPYFRHLTSDREIRICLRYLSDDEYRLTAIAREIHVRPNSLREMFAAYGIDARTRAYKF